MELFYILLVLLVVTRALGELAERAGQPALVGELISGILLGTLVAHYTDALPVLSGLQEDGVFRAITDLGMFFIMLYAGIEMQPSKMLQYSGASLVVAIGGMLVPLALGVGLGWLFLPASEQQVRQALFIGTALAITAVPATVKILLDLGKLESPSGQIIVSAAVFDDVLSLVLLAWLTGLMMNGSAPGMLEVSVLAGKIVLFFIITGMIGFYLFPWGGRFLKHVKEKELDFSLMLIAALAFAVLAEWLQLHFILGAFVAGVFFVGIPMGPRKRLLNAIEKLSANEVITALASPAKHQEAYDLLTPVYNWFTEGCDTPDLKDAKALLGELA